MIGHRVATYPRSMVFPLDAVPIGASYHLIDGTVAAHRHMFVEIAVVLGGRGQHAAERGTYDAQPGDVFVLHPGTWHAYTACQQCTIVNCYFGTELLEHELAWMRADAMVAPLLHSGQTGLHQAATQHCLCAIPTRSRRSTRSIDITAYGNRINAFGALHNIDPHVTLCEYNAALMHVRGF